MRGSLVARRGARVSRACDRYIVCYLDVPVAQTLLAARLIPLFGPPISLAVSPKTTASLRMNCGAPFWRFPAVILLKFENCDAVRTDCFQHCVKGELGLLIEDREIYFEPRCGVGSGFTDHRQSLLVPELGMLLG